MKVHAYFLQAEKQSPLRCITAELASVDCLMVHSFGLSLWSQFLMEISATKVSHQTYNIVIEEPGENEHFFRPAPQHRFLHQNHADELVLDICHAARASLRTSV